VTDVTVWPITSNPNPGVLKIERCKITKKKIKIKKEKRKIEVYLSQIRYSLVVILELNGVSEVQYKDVMMIDDGKYQ